MMMHASLTLRRNRVCSVRNHVLNFPFRASSNSSDRNNDKSIGFVGLGKIPPDIH